MPSIQVYDLDPLMLLLPKPPKRAQKKVKQSPSTNKAATTTTKKAAAAATTKKVAAATAKKAAVAKKAAAATAKKAAAKAKKATKKAPLSVPKKTRQVVMSKAKSTEKKARQPVTAAAPTPTAVRTTKAVVVQGPSIKPPAKKPAVKERTPLPLPPHIPTSFMGGKSVASTPAPWTAPAAAAAVAEPPYQPAAPMMQVTTHGSEYIDLLARSLASELIRQPFVTPVTPNVRNVALTLLHCSSRFEGLGLYALGCTLLNVIIPSNNGRGAQQGTNTATTSVPSISLPHLSTIPRTASDLFQYVATLPRSRCVLVDRKALLFRVLASQLNNNRTTALPGEGARTTSVFERAEIKEAALAYLKESLLIAIAQGSGGWPRVEAMPASDLLVLCCIDSCYREPTKPLAYEVLYRIMDDTSTSYVQWSDTFAKWRSSIATPLYSSSSSALLTAQPSSSAGSSGGNGGRMTLADCMYSAAIRGGHPSIGVRWFQCSSSQDPSAAAARRDHEVVGTDFAAGAADPASMTAEQVQVYQQRLEVLRRVVTLHPESRIAWAMFGKAMYANDAGGLEMCWLMPTTVGCTAGNQNRELLINQTTALCTAVSGGIKEVSAAAATHGANAPSTSSMVSYYEYLEPGAAEAGRLIGELMLRNQVKTSAIRLADGRSVQLDAVDLLAAVWPFVTPLSLQEKKLLELILKGFQAASNTRTPRLVVFVAQQFMSKEQIAERLSSITVS